MVKINICIGLVVFNSGTFLLNCFKGNYDLALAALVATSAIAAICFEEKTKGV